MAGVKLGDRVKIQGRSVKGEVAFIGDTDFSEGTWIGIILDDAKGRNNGTVDGRRYFICPKNHGIFVRVCQVEKECQENLEEQNNFTSTRIIYPNYLKASSNLKSNKHVCESKNQDPNELQVKNPNDQSTENDSKNLDSQLQAVKSENETLKDKLREREKLLQKIQRECSKAMEEIKHLKVESECTKKQIKVQKCHIKLLKMRQCNHYKKVDSSEASGKRSKISKTGDCLDEQGNLADKEIDVSDDEFDFECMKTLASMERIIELEEQNRIMIQGLIELREFLKSICQSPVLDFEIPDSKSNRRKNVKRGDSHLFAKFMNSTATGQSNNSLTASASQRKNYSDMLLEMTKFSEYVSKVENDFGTQNKRNLEQAGDFNTAQKVSTYADKVFQCSYEVPNQLLHNKSSLHVSGIQVESVAFENTLSTGCNNYANNFQATNNANSQKRCNFPSRSKVNPQIRHIGDTTPSKCEDPVDELTQLMSAMVANPKLHPCPSKTSLIEQNRMEAHHSSLKSRKRTVQFQPEFPLSQLKNATEVAVKTGSDGALILPERKKPQRMILSNQINQPQSVGNIR